MFNEIKSNESYTNEKYFKWSRHMGLSTQDRDPSFVRCSLCNRRSFDLKLFHEKGRDFLCCNEHSQYMESL